MRPSLCSNPNRLQLAVATLTRYVPRDCDDSAAVIDGSREVIGEALKACNLPIARHIVNSYAAAVREHYEGIEDQLRPLIEKLGPCVAMDADLACQVQPLARALGLDDLRFACLSKLRHAICAAVTRRRVG